MYSHSSDLSLSLSLSLCTLTTELTVGSKERVYKVTCVYVLVCLGRKWRSPMKMPAVSRASGQSCSSYEARRFIFMDGKQVRGSSAA